MKPSVEGEELTTGCCGLASTYAGGVIVLRTCTGTGVPKCAIYFSYGREKSCLHNQISVRDKSCDVSIYKKISLEDLNSSMQAVGYQGILIITVNACI